MKLGGPLRQCCVYMTKKKILNLLEINLRSDYTLSGLNINTEFIDGNFTVDEVTVTNCVAYIDK
jgi:hypothetical protein